MILILANPQDMHAKHISELLQARGCEVECLVKADFGNGASMTLDPGARQGELELLDGTSIASDSISAIWHRRPGAVRANPTMTDNFDRSFAENEWAQAIDSFFSLVPGLSVSPPTNQRAATKLRQLSLAPRVGLRVPQTLVTSDPEAALAFVARHHGAVVHKAMTAPPHQFIDTRAWDAAATQQVAGLSLCPTILQERVHGPADVRATVVGREIFSACILTAQGRAAVDSRLDADAPCVRYELPDNVASGLLQLMDELGLQFGTVDLKVADDGELVFLEINPQGQFLYIEILTGLPISHALAAFLAQQ